MIYRFFQWLKNHRMANVALVICYSLFLLFAHDAFVNLSVGVMNSLSLPVFQRVVLTGMIVFILLFLSIVFWLARKVRLEVLSAGYFVASLLLLVVHFFVLTEMNVEFIHALMYGGLAVLMYPLIGRKGGSVILCLPVMVVDEWYQLVVLFPHYTNFFEFNDILLDLFGAGLFVSMFGMFGVFQKQEHTSLAKRVEFWFLACSVACITLLMATCVIVPYAVDACSNTWFVLNKLPEMSEFWFTHPVIGSVFHILKPVEGLGAIYLVCLAYLGMDSMSFKK